MIDFFKAGWRRSVRLKDAELFPLHEDAQPNNGLGGVRHKDLPAEFHQHRAVPGSEEGTDLAYLAGLPAPVKRLEGRGLYAGPFFRHYGHFISESLHRLWAYLADPAAFDYIAILPQVPHERFRSNSADDLPVFMRQTLAYMGIPLEKLEIVLDPAIAADLTVPLQASVLGPKVRRPQSYVDFWAEHEARFFAAYDKPLPTVADKIYVSRSNFLADGSFAGERYLEKQLAAEGFQILYPEKMPIVEQLHHYRQARLLVFAEGSALHTTELLGPMKADIVCLQRRPETKALWQSVLHGRSHHMVFFDTVKSLPTMVLARDGALAHDKALSLIDAPALVQYLRQAGFAKLQSFDDDAFLMAEAADVGRYLVNAHLRQTFDFDHTTERLRTFRNALRARGNPYLVDADKRRDRRDRPRRKV